MTQPDDPIRRRRRGPKLEAELLDTAWDLLVENGFARFTMEAVAARAGTGIAVLYRRWANKDELVLAAIERYRANHPVDLPDTGNLRDDLVAALGGMGRTQAPFMIMIVAAAFSGLLAESGLTPAEARDRIMGHERLARVRAIYLRAHERGEIDLDAIPPDVLAMPFDLVRHDLLMTLKPVRPARIRAIVDELFLPLVRGRKR